VRIAFTQCEFLANTFQRVTRARRFLAARLSSSAMMRSISAMVRNGLLHTRVALIFRALPAPQHDFLALDSALVEIKGDVEARLP
jgi:hypothetical protein